MLTLLATALTPIFLGLLFGYAAGARVLIDSKHAQALTVFLMNFALPCSLFVSVARTPRHLLIGLTPLLLILAIAYLLFYFLIIAGAVKFNHMNIGDASVLALGQAFPNAAAVGLPLMHTIFGSSADVAVAIALTLGAVTISPITLAILESQAESERNKPIRERIGGAFMDTVRKPVFWAPVLGLFFAIAYVHVPSWTFNSLSLVGSATAATALFVTGLVASAHKFTLTSSLIGPTVAKNMLQPACVMILGLCFHLSPHIVGWSTLLAAMPSGFFGVIFGGDSGHLPDLASSSLLSSYVFSLITLPAWIIVIQRLHLGL